MDDINSQDKISSSKHYIDLASLLKKKRDPARSEMVEEVLKSDLHIYEKIKEIRKIDDTPDTEYHEKKMEKQQDSSPEDFIKKENIVTRENAENNRKKIKARLKTSEFLAFLFSDFGRIINLTKRIGRKNDFIRYTYFPPRIRLNRRIQDMFESVYQRHAFEAREVLSKVLAVGWMHLTKFEYNLVFQFNELCLEILSTNIRYAVASDESLIDRLKNVENLFLANHYKSIYPETMRSAVLHLIEKYPEWRFDQTRVSELITRLLWKNGAKPSLYNLIRAINIVKHRKFIQFEDLYSVESFEIISTYDFYCEGETKKELQAYKEKVLQELINLQKRKDDVARIEKFIPFNEDESFNFRMLQFFYEKSFKGRNFHYDDDCNLPALFIFNYYDIFVKMYEPFLIGQVELEGSSKVRIFSINYFQFDFAKINHLSEKLSKFKYIFQKFPLERMAALRSTNRSGTSGELEIMQILDELVPAAKSIAFKLIDIDRYHDPYKDYNPADVKPLDQSAIISKSLIIPHHAERIHLPAHLEGLNVLQVITDIITILVLFLIYMDDREIIDSIKSRKVLDKDITSYRNILERVCNDFEYRKYRQTYLL